MKRKILIEKKEKKIWTFLLENDSITEIHCTPENDEKARYQIGDIYIGKVQNIVANIGAAFIEIAPGVNCYFDLQGVPTALSTYKIGKKPLCIGDELLVQISREAVKTKVSHRHRKSEPDRSTMQSSRTGIPGSEFLPRFLKKSGMPISCGFRHIRMTGSGSLSAPMQRKLRLRRS